MKHNVETQLLRWIDDVVGRLPSKLVDECFARASFRTLCVDEGVHIDKDVDVSRRNNLIALV